MKRLMNCRPTEVRHTVGWEWLVEAWISQEVRSGGIDSRLHFDVVRMYVPGRPQEQTRKVAERYLGPPYGYVNEPSDTAHSDP